MRGLLALQQIGTHVETLFLALETTIIEGTHVRRMDIDNNFTQQGLDFVSQLTPRQLCIPCDSTQGVVQHIFYSKIGECLGCG